MPRLRSRVRASFPAPFSEFFAEHSIDINLEIYSEHGTSKANRLRSFWTIESNYTVGKITTALILYGCSENLFEDSALEKECRKIANRLLISTPVAELDSLIRHEEEQDFKQVAQQIREAIDKNQPEAALDRLHTFTTKYIRSLCKLRGIEISREKPLHSIFGEYVKKLKSMGSFESEMAERILKSSISVLEAFNDVRNNRSLTHDNPILNYEESLLIFNHVASSIRFIKSLEAKIKSTLKPTANKDEDLMF